MIKGMTGFGCAPVISGRVEGFVEVKSVNHRYLDIAYYFPAGFGSIEDKIRDLIRDKVERGRITVGIKITKKPAMGVGFNRELAQTYIRQAESLQRRLSLKGTLTLSEIIQLPGVVETKEMVVDGETLWPAIAKGVDKALVGLDVMRKREGKSLARDMKDKLRRMALQTKGIQKRARDIVKEKRKSMTSEEFLSFQKGIDVNEEVSRLVHHIEEFQKLVDSNGAAGKKLDFIAQEMQREANTIGSKLQDKIVSNAVIAIKTKIEKIREQVQNVE